MHPATSSRRLARPDRGQRDIEGFNQVPISSTVSREKVGGTRFAEDVYGRYDSWRLGALSASDQRADAVGFLKMQGFLADTGTKARPDASIPSANDLIINN